MDPLTRLDQLPAALSRRRLLAAGALTGAALTLNPALRPLLALGAPGDTQTYDDGNTDVPGGLTGDPERVIIIGAGWAGLAAANALRNAGVETVILEGRNRIGGRARTKSVGGVPIDLGCSWIHQPIGNPMSTFAQQSSIGTVDANLYTDLPTIRFYDGVSDSEVPLPDGVQAFAHEVNFENEIPDINDALGPGASLRDGARYYLDEQGLTGAARRRAAFILRLFAEETDNIYWDRLSLAYYATYSEPYDGVGEGEFPVGGYTPLIHSMAGDADVRFGHVVHSVQRNAGGVVVRAQALGRNRAHKLTFRGSHVLVTVPLGVLKHGAIDFAQGLPQAKREAIARAGFGRFEKVAMLFDEPFWEDGGKTHVVHLTKERNIGIRNPLTLDLQKINGFPALVSLTAGRAVRLIERLSERERLELARAMLARALGRDVPEPQAFATTNWHRSPFSRGAYSTIVVGGDYPDFDALATPVGGRILFAGEATNRVRFGYADGAMSTGFREAKRLLRSADVQITAH